MATASAFSSTSVFIKRKRLFFLSALSYLFSTHGIFCQVDSVLIPEVNIRTLHSDRPVLREPGSVAKIGRDAPELEQAQTLLPAFNNQPGVRMEERSPGSYRLSVRGSLLRSPFGVRNIKVYLDEMPLTNAGGETYLNLIDQGCVQNIEIHKGPDGSLFGANSGGVVRLNLFSNGQRTGSQAEVGGGSFGFMRLMAATEQKKGKVLFFVRTALQRTDGHRQHSAMNRLFVNVGSEYSYHRRARLRVSMVAASLQYQTPGGLTLEQFNTDARLARTATAFLPGAVEQKAGIYNKTLLGAVTHELDLGKKWKHLVCFFGSATDFRNPFITNYELRDEKGAGLRTWLRYYSGENIKTEFIVGTEQQWLGAKIDNYTNTGGERGGLLGSSDGIFYQGFVFTRLGFDFYNKLLLEFSLGNNYNSMRQQAGTEINVRAFNPQLMPKAAFSYLAGRYISLRGLVSRGYSVPSLQEVRPAPLVFNSSLQPEHGWNYEAGLRAGTEVFRFDGTVFLYRLQSAIVRQVDSTGLEHFVNSGSTRQPGTELMLSYRPKFRRKNESARFTAGVTLYDFKFENYSSAGADYSGNSLTGVPAQVYTGTADIPLICNFKVFIQLISVSEIPLNDANSVSAPGYQLLTANLGWDFYNSEKRRLYILAGCDNILDKKYSLGHDLNAFGGRFYNAAPARNYFARLGIYL